ARRSLRSLPTRRSSDLLPPRDSSWTVRVIAPDIQSASVTIGRNQVTPADVVLAVIGFSNEGNEAGWDVWVNLTLDPFLSFLNARSEEHTSELQSPDHLA